MLAVTIFTILAVTLGVFSPAHREYLYTSLYFATAFFGNINGYVAARFHKFFNGTNWFWIFWSAAVVFPAIFVACMGLVDIIDFMA